MAYHSTTEPCPHTRACRLATLGLAVGGGLLVLALLLGFATREVSRNLASTTLQPDQGRAFTAALSDLATWPWQVSGDGMERPRRSTVRLGEDGQALGPAHSLHQTIIERGGGAFSHWRDYLILSSSDGSDPRTNGRRYQVVAQARLAPLLVAIPAWAGTLLLTGGLVALGRCRREALAALWQVWLKRLHARRVALALAAIPPVAASLWAWLEVPFIWNSTDSALWLVWQWELFPHFPVLYPALMAAATSLSGEANSALTAVVALQHLLAIGAVVYMATAARQAWQILLLALVGALTLSFNLFAHGLLTEAVALPCLLLVIGATLRLCSDALRLGALAVLFGALLAGMLTRHIFPVFALIPMLALLLTGWQRPTRLRAGHGAGPRTGTWLLAIGLTGVTAFGAWAAASGLTALTCRTLDNPCTSIVGRAGVFRVLYTWERLPAGEREAWMADLGARAGDPTIATALRIMATAERPWLGAHRQISDLPTLHGGSADATMNAAFRDFLVAGGVPAVRQWARECMIAAAGADDWQYGPNSCSGQMECLLVRSGRSILDTFPGDARIVSALSGTGGTDPDDAFRLLHLSDMPAVRALSQFQPTETMARTAFVGGSLLLVLLAWRRAGLTPTMASALALWAGAMTYAGLHTLFTVFIVRYLAPIDLLLWSANALALIALLSRPDAAEPGRIARVNL